MKIIVATGITFLLSFCVAASSIAQTADWKTELTKDGKVEVSYFFSESADEKGKKFNVLEYIAVTTAEVSLEACLKVLKTDSLHQEFMPDTENIRRIEDLPEGDWLTYYFMNSRWPMPDCDVITRYHLEENSSELSFILTGSPAPDLYPMEDVPRMRYNDTKYTFTDLGNGTVEMIMYSRSIPLVSVPKWLIKTWIPNGPADMLNGIARLAKEEMDKQD